MSESQADAVLIALASLCEAAGRRTDVAADALSEAESASPHNEAAEAEASRLQGVASDEFEQLATPLLRMRASTLEGVLAKAKAFKLTSFPLNGVANKIEEGLKDSEGVFGPTPISLSLARDLLTLTDQSTISSPSERALILWARHCAPREHCERLDSGPATQAQCQASYDALFAIEKLLQADISVSFHALAAVLVIQIKQDEDREDVPGLWRASLAAIRPQLVGAIAEAADRVLAQKKEEAHS